MTCFIKHLTGKLWTINNQTIGKLPYNFLITSLKGGVDFEFLLILKTLQDLAVNIDIWSVDKIFFNPTLFFIYKRKFINKWD